jgi:hypothetical protein
MRDQEKIYTGSQIRPKGKKKQGIPDPDPQNWFSHKRSDLDPIQDGENPQT